MLLFLNFIFFIFFYFSVSEVCVRVSLADLEKKVREREGEFGFQNNQNTMCVMIVNDGEGGDVAQLLIIQSRVVST